MVLEITAVLLLIDLLQGPVIVREIVQWTSVSFSFKFSHFSYTYIQFCEYKI
jgi:hypothetical protein